MHAHSDFCSGNRFSTHRCCSTSMTYWCMCNRLAKPPWQTFCFLFHAVWSHACKWKAILWAKTCFIRTQGWISDQRWPSFIHGSFAVCKVPSYNCTNIYTVSWMMYVPAKTIHINIPCTIKYRNTRDGYDSWLLIRKVQSWENWESDWSNLARTWFDSLQKSVNGRLFCVVKWSVCSIPCWAYALSSRPPTTCKLIYISQYDNAAYNDVELSTDLQSAIQSIYCSADISHHRPLTLKGKSILLELRWTMCTTFPGFLADPAVVQGALHVLSLFRLLPHKLHCPLHSQLQWCAGNTSGRNGPPSPAKTFCF